MDLEEIIFALVIICLIGGLFAFLSQTNKSQPYVSSNGEIKTNAPPSRPTRVQKPTNASFKKIGIGSEI